MLAANHWFYYYPGNLRRSYFTMLILSWVIVGFIIGYGKYQQMMTERRKASQSESDIAIIMPVDTIRYSDMAPPPSLSSEQIVGEAAMPENAPAQVEDVTSTVPLPVPDEQAEVATMATQKSVAGVVAPAATGTGAPVFVLPETTKVYDDNTPAPVTFKYMKASVMPEPLKTVAPEYPMNARTLGIEGTAILDMWLRKDGSVSKVQIFKSSGSPLLDTAAAVAALKSTFTPARGADGNPVNVWVRRPFNFTLSSR